MDDRFFSEHATRFDERAGIGSDASRRVAESVKDFLSPDAHDVMLEIGSGTGEIGHHFPALGLRYLAMDLSREMLLVFRRNHGSETRRPALIQADGSQGWPIRSGGVRFIFLSRSAHNLAVHRLMDETLRVTARRNGMLVLGRLKRPETSMRGRMREHMLEALRDRGVQGARAQSSQQSLFSALQGLGSKRQEPRVAATIEIRATPASCVGAWREKPGLAGVRVPDDMKNEVLSDLCEFAVSEYGSLDHEETSVEEYVLEALSLPRF